MALMGIAPAIMKPAALALNVPVAIIAAIKFYRVGAFSWPMFWPLALTSVPCAYVGGMLSPPSHIYKPLVGVILLYAAWRSFHHAKSTAHAPARIPARPVLMAMGAVIGLLSGLTGVGGGVFLSPLILFFRWAPPRMISGIAAAFILANSVAGLMGVMSKSIALPPMLPYWALAAMMGAFIGAEFGSKRLGNPAIQKMLALVLLIAGAKMLAMA
jgi:uncharacterized membrane protein YfcA